MIRRLLVRLAASAPVRVFLLEGVNPPARILDLRASGRVALLESPRSANVLLVAGQLPPALRDAARRVHDMLSHPRATIAWTSGAAGDPFPEAMVIADSGDVIETLRQVQSDLVTGRRPSEPALLPDEDPAPWRGVGPYRQGGTGMTGGVPYGRAMAERAADRDGLELDQIAIRVGPFFPPFPPGLTLDLRLQGDIVQDVSIADNPFAQPAPSPGDRPASELDPFQRALAQPVPIAELELARARHHLGWMARALRTHGLDRLGHRLAAMLPRLGPEAIDDVRALQRRLERTRGMGWSTAGIGVIAADRIAGQGLGPVARSAGLREDARLQAAAYTGLDFQPIVQRGGDARARWRQRLLEAAQSLDLAGRAGDRRLEPARAVEGPHGLLTAAHDPVSALLTVVPELLRDLEWGDAVTTIVSLDLELRAAIGSAPDARVPARPTEDAA